MSSPVGAFIRERCLVAPGERVEVSELYAAWRSWCDKHGRKEHGAGETIGRDLRAAVPSLEKTRPRTPEGRLHFYIGIRLRVGSDPDPDDDLAPSGQSGHRGHGDQTLHALPEEGVEDARGADAEEERNGVADAIAGRGDHGDRGGHLFPGFVNFADQMLPD